MHSIQKKYYTRIENFAIGAALFLMMLLNRYFITLWVSVALFVVFLVFLWKNSRIIIKYIIVIFSSLQFIGGGILCEIFPQYLREIGSYTGYIGAIQPLLFYYWLLFTIIWMMDEKFSRFCEKHIQSATIRIGSSNLSKFIFKYGVVFVFFYNLVLFALVFRNPAFSYGVNRFDYNSMYQSSLASKMSIFPLLFCPLVVTVFWNQDNISMKRILRRLIIAYTPYVLYGVWTGNKYGLFTEALFCIMIVFYEDIAFKKKMVMKILLFVVIAVVALYMFLFIYYTAQGATASEALSLISKRIVVEGELWWKTYKVSGNGEMHIDAWKDEVNAVVTSIKTNGNVKEYGVYHLMQLFGAPRIVQQFLSQGIRFAAQGIELSYYSFGYLALFGVPLVMGPLFVVITNLYIHTAKKGLIVAPIVYLRILILLKGCFRQGDWFLYFSLIMVIFYIALIVSIFIRYSRRKKNIY